jgi:hypothetical protein
MFASYASPVYVCRLYHGRIRIRVPTVLWAITGTYMNGPLAGPSAELSESELSIICVALAVCGVFRLYPSKSGEQMCVPRFVQRNMFLLMSEANMYG